MHLNILYKLLISLNMWFNMQNKPLCCKIINALEVILNELIEIITNFKNIGHKEKIICEKDGRHKSIFWLRSIFKEEI